MTDDQLLPTLRLDQEMLPNDFWSYIFYDELIWFSSWEFWWRRWTSGRISRSIRSCRRPAGQ